MSDIVTRLREPDVEEESVVAEIRRADTMADAAAEIERLQARVAELEAITTGSDVIAGWRAQHEARSGAAYAEGFAAAREMAAQKVLALPMIVLDTCREDCAAAIRALRPDGDA
jgi:hypothetical protein